MMQVLEYQNYLAFHKTHPNKENHPKAPHPNESSHEHPHELQDHKQKAELCKKFMDEGYCPFQEKCKFAHGSHELLRNRQQNVKYKTKEC